MYSPEQDQAYMQQALAQASVAADQNEVPIGAIIVAPNGIVIAATHNKTEQQQTQTAHAELLAIAQAGQALGNWRLEGCWVYVTLEPCAMCMHALVLGRIAGVVYGAESPLFGYQLDKYGSFGLYQWPMPIKKGVGADEAAALLQNFFKKRRDGSVCSKKGDRS